MNILTQQLLVFDVGQAFWNQPERFAIFGGYRWWKNKFGIDPNQPNGPVVRTLESTTSDRSQTKVMRSLF
jgi:hypothetical protein